MGGGSMGIRAAARAAFIGGYRSASNARRAVLPSSNSAAADTRPASTSTSSLGSVDDWYIPDREVFGPVPSHEEALAATLDLRDAFDIAKVESHVARTHISHDDLDDPKKVAQEMFQDRVHSEASKHEDKHEDLSFASGSSGRVIEAFTLLQESPEAQDVVASLASDKNVWEAVMKNEKLVQFYKTNLSESSSFTDEAELSDAESSQSSNDVSPGTGDAFSDYIEKMKAFISEMVTSLSSIMQDLVATSDEGHSKGRLKTLMVNTKKDFANGPSSFVLLAIASIFVVLLKRA